MTNRLFSCIVAAAVLAAVTFSGCGDNTYADQTKAAELSEVAGAALIRDGFYTIEIPPYMDSTGKRMAIDTENGTYRPGNALPLSYADDSEGQQFTVTRRAEGIYTIQNANTNAYVKIRTGLSDAGKRTLGNIDEKDADTVEVELWKIVETTEGDIMLVPYMLKTSLFEQITVDSCGNGADFARAWTFTKTQVGIAYGDVTLEYNEVEYTGEPMEPAVSVVKAGRRLEENLDYVVSYEENREIGTARVRVSGIGNYMGDCVAEFEILPIDISREGDVQLNESESALAAGIDENGMSVYAYTGNPIVPGAYVTFNGAPLTEGTDYTVALKNNTDPGTGEIVITGTGIYRGTLARTILIGGVDTEIDLSKTYTFAPKSHGMDRLAVMNGGRTQGIPLDTAAASDEEEAEKFRFFRNENGTYRIISERAGYCLEDVAGSVRLNEYTGSPSQNWTVRRNRDDTFTFENAQTGQVLTAAENTRDYGENAAVTALLTGSDKVPKETRDMHFYLVETDAVDSYAEGYYSATYSGNSSYSISYGIQNGKTGLYIQDGGLSNTMSLTYSGDGWYRVSVGSAGKVLTADSIGNLTEAVWTGSDAQLWRFERSDGTPLTAEMAGVMRESENNVADDGTMGAYAGSARFTARLVNREGMALTAPVDSIDRVLNFTASEFLEAVRNVYLMAHNNHFKYGNSTSAVPCSDGYISCDRLVSRAVYDLGLTDQPNGGYNTAGLANYLVRKGFVTFTDFSTTQGGDIIIVYKDGSPYHTFVVDSYDSSTGMCMKYDFGSQSRIDGNQPFRTALDEWSDKDLAYGIRNPYTREPAYEITASGYSDSDAQLWIFER